MFPDMYLFDRLVPIKQLSNDDTFFSNSKQTEYPPKTRPSKTQRTFEQYNHFFSAKTVYSPQYSKTMLKKT